MGKIKVKWSENKSSDKVTQLFLTLCTSVWIRWEGSALGLSAGQDVPGAFLAGAVIHPSNAHVDEL